MKKIYLFLTLALLSSCAFIKNVPPQKRSYDQYPLNSSLNSEIGETIVEKGTEYFQDGLKIDKISSFSVSFVKFPYSEGEILPLSGTVYNYNLYYIKNVTKTNYDEIGLCKDRKTGKVSAFIQSQAGFATKAPKELEVSQAEYKSKCESCFKKELVYNGKSGTTLKFVYREYVNDMARPAFNQDLQYDLNESNIIGIKGLRVEVLNATNTKIEYKILSSFAD